VNVNITPRVHPNHEVSLKVSIEVSQVNSFQTMAAFNSRCIGQRKIEHDIRLREGEVNILGGLFEKIDSRTVNGWPGLAQIPFIKYLTADNNNHQTENDVLIVADTGRIVRMPDWTRANLSQFLPASEQNITTRRASDIRSPSSLPAQQVPRRNRHRFRRLAGTAGSDAWLRASRSSRRQRTFKVRGYVLIRKP